MPPNHYKTTLVGRLVVAVMAMSALVVPAVAKEPRVPLGLNPGGVAVALLGPGVDYRVPELAKRLARDGEGDLISWDFTDNDTKPFAESGRGTAAALTIAQLAPASQLVIIKERPGDTQAFGHMMTFIARTPTRIVVWLSADPERPDWPILAQAVKRFGARLFVIPAGTDRRDLDKSAAYQGVRDAGNVVIVASDATEANGGTATIDVTVIGGALQLTTKDAALIIAAVAARALAKEPRHSMAGLKQLIVKAPPAGIATRDGYLAAAEANAVFAATK